MFEDLAAERDAKMVVGPGEWVAFDVEVAKLESVSISAVLLRHRLVNQLLVRLPEIGAAHFLVAAELFDRRREVQQRTEFKQPVSRALRRRDALQCADETAHVL